MSREPTRGSGAALGAKVLRLSSIHTLGLAINHSLTLVAAIVVAIYLGPAEFGRFGLLLFLAGLLNLFFNLASKQGTLKRVFGGDDDDEDDEEGEEDLAESRQRSLGTGLALTALISALGTGIVVALAGPVADGLLGGDEEAESLIIWAALAGGFGAILRLASLGIWMEQRPYPYVAAEIARPLITLAITVPLLAGGAGIEAAIAAYAIGSAVAAALSIGLLRDSVELCFDPREALTIMRRGAQRIPVVSSMWTVGYMDLFLLSRFVSDSDLGVYHLASKAGFAVAFLPAGYRKALRPLRRTAAFQAAEDEYGVGTTGGLQLGYFLLMLLAVLLAVTLAARTLERIAPEGYADAAALIPLLSLGLVAPTVYRMVSKSAKFKNKKLWFMAGAVTAALLFIAISLLLIPPLGIWAPPVAMIAAFFVSGTVICVKGQRSARPVDLPARSFFTAAGLATVIGAGYYLLEPPGAILQVIVGVVLFALWVVLIPLSGAIPSYHRGPIKEMLRSLVGREVKRFDPAEVLATMDERERRAVRQAVVRRLPLRRIARRLEEDPDDVAERLVLALRACAAAGGMRSARATGNDTAIGHYLFDKASPADRMATGKELMKSGGVDSGDLHELEAVSAELAKAPRESWALGGGKRG